MFLLSNFPEADIDSRALGIELDERDSFVKLSLPKLTPATKAAIPRNRWSLMLKRRRGGGLKIPTFISVSIPFTAVFQSIRFDHPLLECLSAP